MTELEMIAGIKIGEIALKEILSYMKNNINIQNQQDSIIYLQYIYRKREKAALMKTAVALARTDKLNASNTEAILQTLKEVSEYEYGYGYECEYEFK